MKACQTSEHRLLILLIAVCIAAACSSPADAQTRVRKYKNRQLEAISMELDAARRPLQFVIAWFRVVRGAWPADRIELEVFLRELGTPLTLANYTRLDLAVSESGDSLSCTYAYAPSNAWIAAAKNRALSVKVSSSFVLSEQEALEGERDHVELTVLMRPDQIPSKPESTEPAR